MSKMETKLYALTSSLTNSLCFNIRHVLISERKFFNKNQPPCDKVEVVLYLFKIKTAIKAEKNTLDYFDNRAKLTGAESCNSERTLLGMYLKGFLSNLSLLQYSCFLNEKVTKKKDYSQKINPFIEKQRCLFISFPTFQDKNSNEAYLDS